MVDCLTGLLIVWLIDWLVGWLLDCLIAWLLDCLIDWLIAWLIDWLIDWLMGWLVGWLIDSLIERRNEGMNDRMNRWMDEWIDGWRGGLMDGKNGTTWPAWHDVKNEVNERMGGRVNERVGKWMNERTTDEWVTGMTGMSDRTAGLFSADFMSTEWLNEPLIAEPVPYKPSLRLYRPPLHPTASLSVLWPASALSYVNQTASPVTPTRHLTSSPPP